MLTFVKGRKQYSEKNHLRAGILGDKVSRRLFASQIAEIYPVMLKT